jgi:hypothetical protein
VLYRLPVQGFSYSVAFGEVFVSVLGHCLRSQYICTSYVLHTEQPLFVLPSNAGFRTGHAIELFPAFKARYILD